MTDKRSGEPDLQERIRQAREDLEPKRGPSYGAKYKSLSLAWRMTLELVLGGVVGVAIGWGLDGLFGTKPLFMIVMGLFGFAAGVKAVITAAQNANGGSKETPTEQDKTNS